MSRYLRNVLVAVLCTVPAPVAGAATITTGPVDKAGFNAILAAASPGDTIRCTGGIYDFSDPGAIMLAKSIHIVAADPSDPPLFVGDTTDGTVNGPPVVRTPPLQGNTAFAIPLGVSIDGLSIRGLHFTGFERTFHAWPVGFDIDLPGCPAVPGAHVSDLVVADNQIRQTRRGIQMFGGPVDGFQIRGNDIEAGAGGAFPLLLIGDAFPCPTGGYLNLERLKNGRIKNNTLKSKGSGVIAFGMENVSIRDNEIQASSIGAWIGDDKAGVFADDGPIAFGDFKGNTITGDPLFGLIAGGRTTLTGVAVKNNAIDASWVDLLVDSGGNGLDVSDNHFAGNAGLAEIWLGFDENGDAGGAFPPDSHDNSVKARASDRVFDFGVDNIVDQ